MFEFRLDEVCFNSIAHFAKSYNIIHCFPFSILNFAMFRLKETKAAVFEALLN